MIKFTCRPDLKHLYNYKTAKIKNNATLAKYGMSDRWYGGNAKAITELEDENIALVVDKDFKVLDVLELQTWETISIIESPNKEFYEEAPKLNLGRDQDNYNLDAMDKSEMVILAREKLGGRGYHSMTEENLRNKIKEELGM